MPSRRAPLAPGPAARRAAAAFVTGPVAFLLSGLIDIARALPLALAYLWRSTIRP